MPGHPATMIHKSRKQEEELLAQSRAYQESQALKPRNHRNTARMTGLLQTIFEQFDQALLADPKVKRLAATDFDYLREQYSPPTLVRAKRILGIKSVRRAGFWFWTFPKYAPTEALENIHKRKIEEMDLAQAQVEHLQRAAAVTLKEVMIAAGLIAENVAVLKEMENRGYQRGTTLRMKSFLGIASKKIDSQWMWVWGYRPVQDWLEAFLSAGPQPVQKVYDEAFAEHEWHPEVVLSAKEAMSSVVMKYFNKTMYWMDLNSPGEIPEVYAHVDELVPRRNNEEMTPKLVRNSSHLSSVITRPYIDKGAPALTPLGVHMLGDVDVEAYRQMAENLAELQEPEREESAIVEPTDDMEVIE